MTNIDNWSPWLAIAVTGSPILLAVVSFLYSIYLSRCHLDAIKKALENSRYIYIWGSSLGKRGLIWTLLEMVKITGIITMPKTHIRLGDLDRLDAKNFPPRLKLLLQIKAAILTVSGTWLIVIFALLQLK